jgi:hypothetical protein
MARDPHNGELYVTAVDDEGNLRFWSARTSHDPFVSRGIVSKKIPGNAYVMSVAASHGQIWISFSNTRRPYWGVFLVHRSSRGKWRKPVRLTTTLRRPTTVLVAADPRAGHHGLMEANTVLEKFPGQQGYHPSGVETRTLVGNKIGAAHRYSTAEFDYLANVGVTWSGGVAIAHAVT